MVLSTVGCNFSCEFYHNEFLLVLNLGKKIDKTEIIRKIIENRLISKVTFVLQQYQYSEGVIENYKDKFQKPDHISLINILKPYSKLELPFRIFIRDDIVGYTSLNNALKKLEEI